MTSGTAGGRKVSALASTPELAAPAKTKTIKGWIDRLKENAQIILYFIGKLTVVINNY